MSDSNKIIIAPSMLAADPARYAEEIQSIEAAGADWLHIDVMDGSFVPPITFGDNIVAMAKKCCSLLTDVHLMIDNPDRHLERFRDAGSDRIIVHQEACRHLHLAVRRIAELGMQAGVAINPGTPVETVFDVLDCVDLVLVMTVNPGWGGQKFIPSCISKIEKIRSEITRQSLTTHIEVDGGVNDSTARDCIAAGANVLVAGSYILGNPRRDEAIASLRP